MPGRKLFGNETEFWNPDLLTPQAPCEQLIAAGQRHMHELIAYARSRGIEASAVWSLTDFSKDFRSVIPDAQTVNQLGQLTVAPGPAARPDNPDLTEIGGTVIRTILNEYPEAHSHGFPVGTEWPSWVDLVCVGVAGTRQAIRHREHPAAERSLAAGQPAQPTIGMAEPRDR